MACSSSSLAATSSYDSTPSVTAPVALSSLRPTAEVTSPILNNSWADEVEAFFNDGINSYPLIEDSNSLDITLDSDEESLFECPTLTLAMPPPRTTNDTISISSTTSAVTTKSCTTSVPVTPLIVDLPPAVSYMNSNPIPEGSYVFSLFDNGVFTIIKQLNNEKARCRSVIDYKFRPVRSFTELVLLRIPGVLYPNQAADLRNEISSMRRSSSDNVFKYNELKNLNYEKERELLHVRSELEAYKRELQKKNEITTSMKANISKMEEEISNLKNTINLNMQREERETEEMWGLTEKTRNLEEKQSLITKDLERVRKERNKLYATNKDLVEKANASDQCSGYCQQLERLTNVVADLIDTQDNRNKRKSRSTKSKSKSKNPKKSSRRRSTSTSSSSTSKSRSRSSRS